MKHLNERTQIKDAIKDFVATHGLGTYSADKRGRNIGEELLALDPETATASKIAEIIGNNSWVCEKECNECGKKKLGILLRLEKNLIMKVQPQKFVLIV